MSLRDTDLIALVLTRDDNHAFTELMKRYQSNVRGMLRRLTSGNEVLSDELAQETFLRAYRSLNQFRGGEGKFISWLLRIAYNVYQAYLRSHKPTEPFDEFEHASPHPSAIRSVDWQLDLSIAMGGLNDRERAVITLCYISGFTYEEAATMLKWPLGTVNTCIYTAKEKLRRYLYPWKDRRLL